MEPPVQSNKLILALLCAAMGFAQTPTPKPASVSGAVVNSVTGTPLPRVHVMLAVESGEARTYGAMTTSDGKFSITGMLPGAYSLTLERIGFSMPADEHAPENNSLVLLPEENRNDLRFQ